MGTNYYLWNKEKAPTMETVYEGMHIGKNSAGWVFNFQSYENAMSLEQMKELTKKGAIYDEYAEKHTYEEFWNIVEDSKKPFNGRAPYVLEDPDDKTSFDVWSFEESGFAWSPIEFC